MIALVFWASPGGAMQVPGGQGVAGHVFDADSGAPVERAVVTLLDQRGHELGSTTTALEGNFAIQAHTPGRYLLRVSRLGYLEIISTPLDVREGEWVDVELRVSTQAISLAPLTVVSDRPARVLDPYLERRGYYERKSIYGHLGAYFLDREELRRRHPESLAGVLRTLSGIRVSGAGRRDVRITDRRGRVLSVCLNDMRVGTLNAGEIPLDELVALADVLAIEVYPTEAGRRTAPGRPCAIRVLTGVPSTQPR